MGRSDVNIDAVGRKWANRLGDFGAIWEYHGGLHAELTMSRKHSNFYFNSNVIVEQPTELEDLCREVFAVMLNSRKVLVDRVVTYPPYGIAVGITLARVLGVRFGYVGPETDWSLTFAVSGERVLLACDDLYSGKSIARVRKAVEENHGTISGPICALANLTGLTSQDGLEVVAPVFRNVVLWDSLDCPLCRSGSRAVSARQQWKDLKAN